MKKEKSFPVAGAGGGCRQRVTGICSGAWGYFLGGLAAGRVDAASVFGRSDDGGGADPEMVQLVVVTSGPRSQERLAENMATALRVHRGDLRVFGEGADSSAAESGSTGEGEVYYFPGWEVLPHENKLPHADVISDRLETLMGALRAEGRFRRPVVASIESVLQKTFDPGWLAREARRVRVGDELDPLDLIEWLEDCGYEPEVQVSGKGQVAMRGGIVDIFPVSMAWPVRLEFFGDEVESIRTFDPLSQLSRERLEEVDLSPGGELGVLKRIIGEGSGTGIEGREKEKDRSIGPASLDQYYPTGTLWVFCDVEAIEEAAEHFLRQVPEGDPFFLGLDELRESIHARGQRILEITESGQGEPDELVHEWNMPSLEEWSPVSERVEDAQVMDARRHALFDQFGRWIRGGYQLVIFCSNDGEGRRIRELWSELKILPEEMQYRQPPILEMSYAPGFLDEKGKTIWVTDAEIFGRVKHQRPRKLRSRHAPASRSALEIDFSDLQEGDLVVHLQYGIARFAGMTQMSDRNDNSRECLALEFAPQSPDQPNPRLYVPVTEAHLVSKYVGAGKARPPLNSMTGTRWQKARKKAEEAVEDLAAEFLRIQALREASGGYAFQEDSSWQREFEGAFPFQETDDQIKAIDETKRDMESARPMDRLICGDVGYGKTEVAIRAAFKAVMDGKQVAILVPTTVLCQQHYMNFRDRMAAYPFSIQSLSRFQGKRVQKEIISGLADGSVDIVIGTHRLLQKDIVFRDLGLVVIDEEQRFGVLHKEKFKMLRATVDVLTLSATPIPRTLYLSLTGARDLSTIETPPQDRLPVETIIHPYDERVIRDAIQRELNRNGQVFFLHNRVDTIHTVEARLHELVPDARVIVGHGQMTADELEKVMTRFVNGDADVLLSTTIIESGIDIPNANTIIIDRADRFGLSQLYQLRGRVGRYKHQAYAYLLLPRHMRLVTDVRKRMSAIKQYSSLGSGFKIAMRDLEIRGSGNLLGAEQSGHITAVGFELYCQLLKQSISRLKGETVKQRIDVAVVIDFLELNPSHATAGGAAAVRTAGGDPIANACLPYEYIREQRHRVEIYRKLAQVTDMEDLEQVASEVRDRFGAMPHPVELLFLVTEIKVLAASKLISRIECEDSRLQLTRNNQLVTLGGKFPRLTKKAPEARLREIRRLIQAF